MTEILKCLVVDDDPISQRILQEHVAKTEFLQLMGVCGTAMEAAAALRKEPVDLIFLDIELPEMTGLELLQTLSNKPEIVLVTGKEEYAADAWEQDVLDYIVKPVTYPRFLRAANKALEKQGVRSEMKTEKNKLFVRVDSRLVPVEMDKILYVEAKADYVTINTDEKRHTVYSTMKGIESKLPEEKFIRVHRSFIINKEKIDSIEDNLVVIGDKMIPVGVTYKDKLMDQLNLL
jgi:two-component system, LytTR family, response regulator